MTTMQHEEKLIDLWAKLGAAMIQRGLDHARVDDPHNQRAAAQLLQDPGAMFELRCTFDKFGARGKTTGLVLDANGEVKAEVFVILAAQDGAA